MVFVVILLMLVKHGTANETKIIENAKTYSQSLVPEIYALTKKCVSLLDVMQTWIENRK